MFMNVHAHTLINLVRGQRVNSLPASWNYDRVNIHAHFSPPMGDFAFTTARLWIAISSGKNSTRKWRAKKKINQSDVILCAQLLAWITRDGWFEFGERSFALFKFDDARSLCVQGNEIRRRAGCMCARRYRKIVRAHPHYQSSFAWQSYKTTGQLQLFAYCNTLH